MPVSPDVLRRLLLRHRAMIAVRAFFSQRDVIECDTPLLVACPGLEPHIDPLAVDVRTTLGDDSTVKRYLITSPELAMKTRVALSGLPLFQLGKVFRDGEGGPHHHVEFTMLEWYRPGLSQADMIKETSALLACIAQAVATTTPARVDFSQPAVELSCAEAFARYADVDLDEAITQQLHGDDLALGRALKKKGQPVASDCSFEDAFVHAMVAVVEPRLVSEFPRRLVALTRWPASMAVLARTCSDDARYAERFEMYGDGSELCNAFVELTDPVEQRARFEADNRTRARLGKPQLPIDEAFLSALPHLGPTSGNAVGFDRVLMLATGAHHISDVLP